MVTPEEAREMADLLDPIDDIYVSLFHSKCADAMRNLAAQVEALQADADRYRFLRMQHWSESKICVVSSPKEAVKLGYDCPCTDRLDAAIDAQIAARKDQQ